MVKRRWGYARSAVTSKSVLLEKGKRISLNYTTLRNLSKWWKGISNLSTTRRAGYSLRRLRRLSHTLLRLPAGVWLESSPFKGTRDQICRARLGKQIQLQGLASNGLSASSSVHSDRLHVYTPAQSIPHVAKLLTSIQLPMVMINRLRKTQLHGDNGKPIPPECTWAMDKSGFQQMEVKGGSE